MTEGDLATEIAAAVAAERERCAVIAETLDATPSFFGMPPGWRRGMFDYSRRIADEIRVESSLLAGGEPKAEGAEGCETKGGQPNG